MKVRFSPDIFRSETRGGVSRYVVELHRGLIASGVDSRILAFLHISDHLDDVDRVVGADVSWFRPKLVRQALTKGFDDVAARGAATRLTGRDVLHLSYFHPRPTGRAKVAVTVYDMIHERFPETSGPRDRSVKRKREACRRADVVFVISETTRVDLLERMPELEERVVVTPLGVRRPSGVPSAASPLRRPYIVYLGDRRRPYKNVSRLLTAFAAIAKEHHATLVYIGGGAISASEAVEIERLGLREFVVHTSGDDRHVAGLLRGAAALVCPSLYEGFSLPVVEAMAEDCPVVAAAAGAIPEVVGDAALLFDPMDVDSIRESLARVLTDEALGDVLRQRGRHRAAMFSWDQTVRRTLEAYETIT